MVRAAGNAVDLAGVRYALRELLLDSLDVDSCITPDKFQAENRAELPLEPTEEEAFRIEEYFDIITEVKVATGIIETIGRAAYHVVVPAGRGTELQDTVTLSIAKAFEPATSITSTQGVGVHIDRAERGTGFVRDGIHFVRAVFVNWRSYQSTLIP